MVIAERSEKLPGSGGRGGDEERRNRERTSREKVSIRDADGTGKTGWKLPGREGGESHSGGNFRESFPSDMTRPSLGVIKRVIQLGFR